MDDLEQFVMIQMIWVALRVGKLGRRLLRGQHPFCLARKAHVSYCNIILVGAIRRAVFKL
jgi:hypothetical protein